MVCPCGTSQNRVALFHPNQRDSAMAPPGIPSWVKPFLTAAYFVQCEEHGEAGQCECNYFCLLCKGNSVCSHCLPNHKKHPIVQIRRSSHNDVVKLDEISKYIDASQIQTYRINDDKIIFLRKRPFVRSVKCGGFACDICKRKLLHLFKFCSLACKIQAVKEGRPQVAFESPKMGTELSQEQQQVSTEGDKDSNTSGESSDLNSPRHRRKGIPRRAPFF